jgi:peptidoglycan/LPS O-acetylase OafA/YrhL
MATALTPSAKVLNTPGQELDLVSSSGARTSIKRFYHPELDVLRFFAFLLVFVHHHFPATPARYDTYLASALAKVVSSVATAGAFGVDVFFALSSYLITELLLREKSRGGRVDVKSFYIRRILRIWPLYFFFLALAVSLNGPLDQQISWKTIVAFLLFSGNWWMILAGKSVSVINPLWSISIEEQFYLAWPPIVRHCSERGLLLASCVMCLISNTARVSLVLLHLGSERYFWFNTLTRLDPIALGIAAAVLLRGRSPRLSAAYRVLLFVASLGLLLASANILHTRAEPVSFVGVVLGYPIVAVSSVGLLISFLTVTPPWYARGPLVYLGRISYGLYVFHLLALKVADIVHARFGLLSASAIGFLLTIVSAMLSFQVLEKPFLRLKERYSHVLSRPGG